MAPRRIEDGKTTEERKRMDDHNSRKRELRAIRKKNNLPVPSKRIVEGKSEDERARLDDRNSRKRSRRTQRRLANETPGSIRKKIVARLVSSVICKVKERAKDRLRRRAYVNTHKNEESEKSKQRNSDARARRLAAPAAVNNNGIYAAVAKVAAAAVSGAKSMAHDRARSKQLAKVSRPRINKRKRDRKASDADYAVIERLRTRLWGFLQADGKLKCKKTAQLVGISDHALTSYLNLSVRGGERLLKMQIDHVFPMARYSSSDADQRRMMHFSNLQPLSKTENIEKKDKLPTKAMAAKVDPSCWPDGVTMDMLPDIYPGWATPLRMHAASSSGAGSSSLA